MTAREMTRRSLLAAAGGAAAGALARPRGALATFGRQAGRGTLAEPVLFEHAVGALPAGTVATAIDLGRNADLVGVRWSGPRDARVALRFAEGLGTWSPWVSAGAHGHGPDVGTRSDTGDPVWTGGATAVELRADRALREVSLSCVDVSGGRGARRSVLATGPAGVAVSALEPLAPALPAGPGQPPIIARRAWARGMARPRVAPEYGAVRMAFVHHTENPNGYSPGEVPLMLRAIYAFHRYTNGWNDIGYNFVIDLFGRIFEARAGGVDEPVIGAQAGGYNYVSTGVAVLGEFMSVPISAPARSALERLLAWKLSLHGAPADGQVAVRVDPAGAVYSRYPAGARVSLPRVAGHRDGDSTDCPGNVLYAELPGIRPRIHALAGRVARASIALGPPAASTTAPGGPAAAPPGETTAGGQQPPPEAPGSSSGGQAGEARTLTGSLTLLDGTPLAGAPIEVQVREVSDRGESVHERTVAQASTDATGAWSLPVAVAPVAGGIWLRASCPGADGVPASVSESLRLPGLV